ncbi:MAG: class I SAM-dependent methyltransferase [Lachnospiraceae bacterium]|nr:class I SAM-dependent methyltransferase [Lachnospiraceae bacterium]
MGVNMTNTDKMNTAQKVVIYGCGLYGRGLLFPLICQYGKTVIAYVDKDEKLWGSDYRGVPVKAPEELKQMDYDLVLISVNHPVMIEEIKEELRRLDVSGEKVCEIMPDIRYLDLFYDQRIYWIQDYARWIYEKGIQGNVAECGVFKGDSAKFLNKFFPDRKLYLFDTFEGFSDLDLKAEKELGNEEFNNSVFANTPIFDETSVSFVMKKMTYPGNVIVKKGYFPDSANGVEDKFCFINLDMDLYVPMLSALRFFWDKVEPGGAVILHDYFKPELPGVKEAVAVFEKEHLEKEGHGINKVPVGDGCSIVLLKDM